MIGFILGWKCKTFMKNYVTTVIGSYIFVRGLTYFGGGYPTEMQILEKLTNDDPNPIEFKPVFWTYLILFFVFTYIFVLITAEGGWDRA